MSAGQDTECFLGIGGSGLSCTGTKPRTDLDPGIAREASELVFDLLGSCDNQSVQLVDGLGACLDRRTTGHLQHAYPFDRSVTSFGSPGGLPAQDSPSRCFGVGGVGLTQPTAQLPIGTVHLYHLDTCLG